MQHSKFIRQRRKEKNGRVQISRIFDYANDDSRNRHKAKKKKQRLRKFFVVKDELLAIEESIRES